MSCTDQQNAKRQRTDSSLASPTSIPFRSEIWYDDGNIILEAERTQFRVFRGVLSASSEVFRDMFAMPQPGEGESLVEGCAIVWLTDSAEDWRYVLKALFERSYVSVHSQRLPLKIIAAFLRLGKKYEITQLHLEATTRLTHDLPSTLEKWDSVSSEYEMVEEYPGLPYDIVNLAREQGLYAVLPVILYTIVIGLDLDTAYNAVQRGDGSSVVLSVEDQIMRTRGWWRLIRDQAKLTFGWLDTNGSWKGECAFLCITHRNAFRSMLFPVAFPPVLECQALRGWDSEWGDTLCENCARTAQKLHEDGRAEIWRKLPLYFGLPAWEELLNSD